MSLLTTKCIDLEIRAIACKAGDEWPQVIIRLNQQVIYNDCQPIVIASAHDAGDVIDIEIELTGKSDKHTKVDHNGVIIENQAVILELIKLNGVDLIRTGLIHRVGQYTMNLTSEKQQLFDSQGISTQPSTSLGMYENGVWHITVPQPALSYLSALQAQIEPWEQGNWQHLTMQIYKHIEICKELENQSKAADQDNY